MAFLKENLHAIGGVTGNAPAMWSYTTEDTLAAVNTADYLNDAYLLLNAGDTIILWTSTAATAVPVLSVVLVSSDTGVELTAGILLNPA